jgi:mercuric ion binding protein
MPRKLIIIVLMSAVVTPAASAASSEQQVVLAIEGMTCEICAVAVKKSLKEVTGVRSVKVSFEEKKAWLTADTAVTDEMLVRAVGKAGPYTGKVIEKKKTAD